MQNRKRLTNILIAGTLTVLVLTVLMVLRGPELSPREEDRV